MNVKNEALKEHELFVELGESTIALLEAIGIELYSKYGISCYNYGIHGSPIDVELILNYVYKIQDKGMDILPNGSILALHDNIELWAELIVQFQDLYPEY